MLADGLGLRRPVRGLLAHLFERWDGKGPLGRAKGEEIPLPMRIVHVAVDAAFQRLLGGEERVVRLVRERAGHAFDPEVAGLPHRRSERILALEAAASVWEETLACEPRPLLLARGARRRPGARRDGQLRRPDVAVSRGALQRRGGAGRRGGRRCRIDEAGVVALRRAALVHDLGRVAVHPRIWQKPGPLTADELEQVRLHPYHSERVLARSRVPGGARAGRRRAPRAPRRLRLPPRRHRRRSSRFPHACSRPRTPTTR